MFKIWAQSEFGKYFNQLKRRSLYFLKRVKGCHFQFDQIAKYQFWPLDSLKTVILIHHLLTVRSPSSGHRFWRTRCPNRRARRDEQVGTLRFPKRHRNRKKTASEVSGEEVTVGFLFPAILFVVWLPRSVDHHLGSWIVPVRRPADHRSAVNGARRSYATAGFLSSFPATWSWSENSGCIFGLLEVRSTDLEG